MQVFNRTATRLRKERRRDEIAYTARGDISVYSDAVRRGEAVYPITAETTARIDYTQSGGGLRAESMVALIVEGPGWAWRQTFMQFDEKRAERILDAIQSAALAMR